MKMIKHVKNFFSRLKQPDLNIFVQHYYWLHFILARRNNGGHIRQRISASLPLPLPLRQRISASLPLPLPLRKPRTVFLLL